MNRGGDGPGWVEAPVGVPVELCAFSSSRGGPRLVVRTEDLKGWAAFQSAAKVAGWAESTIYFAAVTVALEDAVQSGNGGPGAALLRLAGAAGSAVGQCDRCRTQMRLRDWTLTIGSGGEWRAPCRARPPGVDDYVVVPDSTSTGWGGVKFVDGEISGLVACDKVPHRWAPGWFVDAVESLGGPRALKLGDLALIKKAGPDGWREALQVDRLVDVGRDL